MSYKNKKHKKSSPNKLFAILAVLILLAGLLFVLEKTGVINLYEKPKSTQANPTPDEINLNPPTEEELQTVENNKLRIADEEIKNDQVKDSISEDQKRIVKPIIGYLEIKDGAVRANGFISSVIEEGGTCTLTLVKDSLIQQTTSTSLADAQSTVCGLMEISTDKLSSGKWFATISYQSDKYEGVSDEQFITVQ